MAVDAVLALVGWSLTIDLMGFNLYSIIDHHLITNYGLLVVDWVLVCGVTVVSLTGLVLSFRRFSEFAKRCEPVKHSSESVQEPARMD